MKQKKSEKKIFKEVTIVADGNERKAAFAKGINRIVNLKNAETICGNIKKKGYRKAEKIQVIEAEKAIKNRDITLVDINGELINETNASEYYLVVDGQHRVYAVAEFNQWVEENGDSDHSTITVPAEIVELVNGETVAEYINDINITKQEWRVADYVQGAANVHKNNEFLQTYKGLIKSKENPNGFPISTLNRIYCKTQSDISLKDFSILCSGETKKGKNQDDIIPAHNIADGNRFIKLCRSKGFADKDIAKRFLITQFRDIETRTSRDNAFKVFEAITPNDKGAMYNERKNLDEKLVKEQIQLIINRLNENE